MFFNIHLKVANYLAYHCLKFCTKAFKIAQSGHNDLDDKKGK